MHGRFAKVSFLFALGSSGCALNGGAVTRVADGVEAEGRPVSATAYAYYSRGVMLEGRGDRSGALREYQQALGQDPNSAELHARVGNAECSLSESAGDAAALRAEQSFTRALQLDPAFEQCLGAVSALRLPPRTPARGARRRTQSRAARPRHRLLFVVGCRVRRVAQ
ncbi:MAG: hypothetical protein QM756_31640 [Polyangiaceae bacterium]